MDLNRIHRNIWRSECAECWFFFFISSVKCRLFLDQFKYTNELQVKRNECTSALRTLAHAHASNQERCSMSQLNAEEMKINRRRNYKTGRKSWTKRGKKEKRAKATLRWLFKEIMCALFDFYSLHFFFILSFNHIFFRQYYFINWTRERKHWNEQSNYRRLILLLECDFSPLERGNGTQGLDWWRTNNNNNQNVDCWSFALDIQVMIEQNDVTESIFRFSVPLSWPICYFPPVDWTNLLI